MLMIAACLPCYCVNLEALKTLKGATDNQVAKTLGADKFADGQIVKAVGMTLGKDHQGSKIPNDLKKSNITMIFYIVCR